MDDRPNLAGGARVPADELAASADAASDLLKSLANPIRLRLLCLLAERETSVGEMADAVGVRQSVVSQHLALLRKDDIVMTRRDGQTIWYSLADPRVLTIIETLHAVFCPQRPISRP